MAANYIEVDPAQLNADIRELEENTAKAKASFEALKAELGELNTMWKGRANMAFCAQLRKDYSIMDKLLHRMDKLSDCMEHADREYVKCEQAVKSTVESIKI